MGVWVQADTEFTQAICTDDNIWNLSNGGQYSKRVAQMSSGLTLNRLMPDSDITTSHYWVVGDSNVGIYYDYNSSSGALFRFYLNGEAISYPALTRTDITDRNGRNIVLMCGYNSSTNKYKAIIGGVADFYDRPVVNLWVYSDTRIASVVEWIFNNPPVTAITSNGGGATHIAKRTGQLKDLSSYTSDILIVSGGGGGGLIVGETSYSGKEAGGISGSGDNSADQTTGNAFGLGESGTNLSGGGSGLYGGYKGTSSKSGGAGSGYIGNSLLSNKKMVGYNVPTSSAEGTKTESVNDVSASAVSGKPKSGNGFARIKLVSQAQQKVDISASNQLKNNGVSPTVVDGQMGSYDSESNSYFFNGICSWKYTNGIITKSQLQNAKMLILEMEVKLLNDSSGNYTDTTIHIRYGDTGYRLLGVIAGNGNITTGDYSFFWMNDGNIQKNDTAPLDISGNRGTFHNVRFILKMNNGIINNLECYIDDNLYKSKEINQALELQYDEYNIFCDTLQKSYVKSYKVEVV